MSDYLFLLSSIFVLIFLSSIRISYFRSKTRIGTIYLNPTYPIPWQALRKTVTLILNQ